MPGTFSNIMNTIQYNISYNSINKKEKNHARSVSEINLEEGYMIGIDLIRLERIKDSVERFGEKFLQRFLSQEEIALVKNHKTAAGFWAAKEACSKALGTGIGKECGFHDIRLTKTDRGAPKITLSEHLIENHQVTDTSISITHDGDYAIAVVAIETTK